MICTGICVVAFDCGLAPTIVKGYVFPCESNDPEKCGTLKMRPCVRAMRASGESLLAPSNLGCAPSRCRNPPVASIGCEVSVAALWANALTEIRQKSASAPQNSLTRLPNRSGLKDTYPSSGSCNLLFSYYRVYLSNKIV